MADLKVVRGEWVGTIHGYDSKGLYPCQKGGRVKRCVFELLSFITVVNVTQPDNGRRSASM